MQQHSPKVAMPFKSVGAFVFLSFVTITFAGREQLASPLVTIPLDKQYVPVVLNNRTVSHKTIYFGKIFLGLPKAQNFTVVFDTGSGHLLVPSTECHSDICLKHHRYDRPSSASAEDIDIDGAAIKVETQEQMDDRDRLSLAFGTGQVEGTFVRETICLLDPVKHTGTAPSPRDPLQHGCTHARVVLADEMTEDPFGTFKFDGVLGLGLDTLSIDPEFNLLGQLSRRSSGPFRPQFAYFLSRNDEVPSEISFGGYDTSRVDGELQWSPIHSPEEGYWQLKLDSVFVAGEAIPLCEQGGCLAIADTGTSLLGVPKAVVKQLHVQLARSVEEDDAEVDCRNQPGPDLTFNFVGGVTLTLGPEEYSRPAPMILPNNKTGGRHIICRSTLLPVDHPVLGSSLWILGEPVLLKYYTVYDWERKQVGFAPALAPAVPSVAESGTAKHSIYGSAPPPRPTGNAALRGSNRGADPASITV